MNLVRNDGIDPIAYSDVLASLEQLRESLMPRAESQGVSASGLVNWTISRVIAAAKCRSLKLWLGAGMGREEKGTNQETD